MGQYKADSPNAAMDLQKLFGGLERLMLPVDQLQWKNGQLWGGIPESGTRADRLMEALYQSTIDLTGKFAPQLQDLQQQLIQGQLKRDPIARGVYDATLQSIADLNSAQAGKLPEGLQRNMLEAVRSSGASRGILESPVAAAQEVASSANLYEGVRQSRLSNVLSLLTGVPSAGIQQTQSPISMLNPMSVVSPAFGQLPGLMGLNSQTSQFNAQMGYQADSMLGQGAGSFAGLGLGLISSNPLLALMGLGAYGER